METAVLSRNAFLAICAGLDHIEINRELADRIEKEGSAPFSYPVVYEEIKAAYETGVGPPLMRTPGIIAMINAATNGGAPAQEP